MSILAGLRDRLTAPSPSSSSPPTSLTPFHLFVYFLPQYLLTFFWFCLCSICRTDTFYFDFLIFGFLKRFWIVPPPLAACPFSSIMFWSGNWLLICNEFTVIIQLRSVNIHSIIHVWVFYLFHFLTAFIFLLRIKSPKRISRFNRDLNEFPSAYYWTFICIT